MGSFGMNRSGIETLYQGKHLNLVRADRWEYATRVGASGVVGILAVTPERKLLLVEQYRKPVDRHVIELPAGLAGDRADAQDEALAVAARRELLEETGYDADRFELLSRVPSSAGLTDETVVLYRAYNLKKVSAGGGDATEDIVVHEVPLNIAGKWLADRAKGNRLIDFKVFAGLWFIEHEDWSK